MTLAALLVLAAPAARAQGLSSGIPLNQEDAKTPEQIAKQKATEDAYKATLKKIPDAKPVDPWGNMRSVDTPKTTQAKAKTKSTSKKTSNLAN
jgi:hypothetical protein